MSGILSALSGGSYGSPPANTVAPAVSGTATFGQTLSSTTGTWTGVPTPTFTYQWQRAGTNISGATSSTYTLVSADVGSTIRCVVTATNAISVVSANSNSTASVAAAVPGAPTIGTATQTGSTTATITFTAPASNGGATITSYTAVSSPGGITGTLSQAGSGTISVSGLTASTSYTFTVYATNSIGNSAASSASNSITTAAPPYMCISTSGATVTTCGNYKIAVWNATGSFTVNSLGASSGYGNHINYWGVGGGGGGAYYGGGGAGSQGVNCAGWMGCLASSGIAVTARSYTTFVGSAGSAGVCSGTNGIYSELRVGSCNFAGVWSQQGYGGTTASGGGSAAGVLGRATGVYYCGKYTSIYSGGGGAGTDYRASNGTGSPQPQCAPQKITVGSFPAAGNGGAGFSMNFNGSTGVTLASGGGGGGAYLASSGYSGSSVQNPCAYGLGGSYGGGRGAYDRVGSPGGTVQGNSVAGTANTGGGGGAGENGNTLQRAASNGGSGKIAIRWRFQ